jgi:outer membrane protein assembly factor BamD
MKNTFIISIIAFVALSTSCSEYNKVVKSEEYERKLLFANEYYQRGSSPKIKHEGKKNQKEVINSNVLLRSVTLYEQIYQRMPKTSEGELSYFRIGKAYYLSDDYYMAGYYLGMFGQRFPYSVKAEESLFLSAMCSVNNSPQAPLDQTETELAINDLQQFIDKYPSSTFIDSCNTIIDGLRSKLERKAFNDVALYDKTNRYGAAVSSATTFLDDYPMSTFKEEVYFVLVENSYLLAKNSVESKKTSRIKETIERYNTFVTLFPTSEKVRTLKVYHDDLSQEQ